MECFAFVHFPTYLFLAFLLLPPYSCLLGASATLDARLEYLQVEGTGLAKIRKMDQQGRGHEKASNMEEICGGLV